MENITIGTVKMPLQDFVISRNAILGITKSGKTYTAKGIAEQMLEAKVPIIVFDAIGVWRFLKVPAARHGGKGFEIVVAGGSHPDLPLTPQSAPEIVRAAIRENIPLVIDLYDSKLSKADWRRIVQESFRILLYENKGLRHIFLEEAAEYAPQKVMDGQTYAEVEKLARMGGNRSLGITFINQRAQELNKAVLELCDNIILLRQRGTHAIDSLERQMDKLSPTLAKEIALTMPNMTQGDSWIFTENGEVPIRTKSGLIRSFHPDRRHPDDKQVLAKAVNTDIFVQTMADKLPKLLAEKKENDPAELKKIIKGLETQLAAKPTAGPAPEPASILTDADRKLITRLLDTFPGQIEKLSQGANALVAKALETLRPALDKVKAVTIQDHRAGRMPVQQPMRVKVVQPVRQPRATIQTGDANSELGRCERALLVAAVQRHPKPSSRAQIAVLSGYSSNSSSFANGLGKLRSLGLLAGQGDDNYPTDAGITEAGELPPMPTGDALVQHWSGKLDKAERTFLEIIVRHQHGITKAELSEISGYSQNSSSFANALGKLRTLELITRGEPIKPTEELL